MKSEKECIDKLNEMIEKKKEFEELEKWDNYSDICERIIMLNWVLDKI